MKRIKALFTALIIMISLTYGQTPEKRQYKAEKITVSPEIDGILDDEAWTFGTWDNNLTQWQPYNGRPESQKTEFKILFDENNLYVAIKAFDSYPDSIVKRLIDVE